MGREGFGAVHHGPSNYFTLLSFSEARQRDFVGEPTDCSRCRSSGPTGNTASAAFPFDSAPVGVDNTSASAPRNPDQPMNVLSRLDLHRDTPTALIVAPGAPTTPTDSIFSKTVILEAPSRK